MDKTLKEKLLAKEKWAHGLLILLFGAIYYIVSSLIYLIAIFQFITDLLFGHLNNQLVNFSKRLNVYLIQIANFLTFNSDVKPFPFTDWPENPA
jgi:hypothetical protein